MIIPVRCFNCNKVLAHLWEPYLEKIQELANAQNLEKMEITVGEETGPSPEAVALDELSIMRYCCRATMMGNVDLTNDIVKTTYSMP